MARRATLDIETYNRKRDFAKTKEPRGRKLRGKDDSFVVQKHAASRLHWDFRLELDGVLKSWAVPRGPSLDPGEKRLAMRTEDHPLDYGGFEGTIACGEYGGGTVMLWEKGRWIPDPRKDPSKTIEEGHLHFTLEGYRVLLAVGDGVATAWTRNGKDWSDKFKALVKAAAKLPAGCLIDGEAVALDDKGLPSFQLLQSTLQDKQGANLAFYAFDLLVDRGEDIKRLPTIERKQRLAALLKGVPAPILFGDHVIGRGEELFREICKQGGEGIISKKSGAPYRNGRTRDWLKIKCIQRQEFVIVGWSESDKRRGFRSLLLAMKEKGKLTYAGKVGTGFNAKLIEELMERMEPLAVDKAPVEVPRADRKGAHWIKPQLVAEIAFSEFTDDGILRHPSFIALREDKPAKAVVREVPKHTESVTKPAKRKAPSKAKRAHATPEDVGIEISSPE